LNGYILADFYQRSLKLRNEERIREHKCKGTKNDEEQGGTICNANNGTSNENSCISDQTNDRSTTNDIST